MLAIRMQRTGRRGHAQFRVIVQDARRSPSSGQVVARLGSYNPHTKIAALNSEKTSLYLQNGAQPSERVAKLLKKEGIKLPHWVSFASDKKSAIKNPDKLRRNRPLATEAPQVDTEASQNEEAPVSVETEPEIATSEGEGTPVEATPESLEGLSDTKPADALETSAEETPVEVAIDETKNQVKIEAQPKAKTAPAAPEDKSAA